MISYLLFISFLKKINRSLLSCICFKWAEFFNFDQYLFVLKRGYCYVRIQKHSKKLKSFENTECLPSLDEVSDLYEDFQET